MSVRKYFCRQNAAHDDIKRDICYLFLISLYSATEKRKLCRIVLSILRLRMRLLLSSVSCNNIKND